MSTPIAVHKSGQGAPPKGAGTPSSGGLAALIKGKPAAAAAAGGVVLVVLVAMLRHSSTDPSASSGQSADTLQMTGAGSTYDSTSTDLYNSIQPEIDALAKMMQDLQNAQSTPAPTNDATATAVARAAAQMAKKDRIAAQVQATRAQTIADRLKKK